MNALLTKSTTDAPQSASKTPFLTPSTSPSQQAARLGNVAASSVGASTRGKHTPTELMVMRGSSKSTGQRVWAVQSASQSKAAGYPVFHTVTWDAARASWVCPCPAHKPCIHMRLASEASQGEQQRIDAAFDALTAPYPDYDDSNPHRDELEVLMKAEPIIVRNDTGPRLFRGPLSPVLAERVREVW